MKIAVRNCNNQRLKILLKDLARTTLSFFFSDSLLETIRLTIVLDNNISSCDYIGVAMWDLEDNRPKTFTIRLSAALPKTILFLTLAHELVHVKQAIRREIIPSRREQQYYRWADYWYDIDRYDYYSLPWEIEAHGREKGLYYNWLDESTELTAKERGLFGAAVPY
jgi:hypothetical protein